MNYSKTCDCCGHQNTAYAHKLNAPMILALKELFSAYDGEPVNIVKNSNLTFSQKNNFQKLRHFNLVYKTPNVAGYSPTKTGREFLLGEKAIFDLVATINNKVLPMNHECWETHREKPREMFVWEFLDEAEWDYKKRPEYQQERSNQMSIL